MKNIIYTNGCSFTAGTDLADRYFLKNYIGTEESRIQEIKLLFQNPTEFKKFCDKEKELAWPNCLEQLVNIRVFNEAKGGSSQEQIVLESKHSLLRLKKRYNIVTAIIQLTLPGRFLYPGSHRPNGFLPWDREGGDWSSVLISETYKEKGKQLMKEVIPHWPFYHIDSKYVNDTDNLINFCKVNNINLILIPLIDGVFYDKMIDGEVYDNSIRELFFKENYFWRDQIANSSKSSPNGHPSKDAHKSLAEMLAALPIFQKSQ
jgi:hypothetical protein